MFDVNSICCMIIICRNYKKYVMFKVIQETEQRVPDLIKIVVKLYKISRDTKKSDETY